MIYLDNAATTATNRRVLEEMLPFFTENYGNPSSTYNFAHESAAAIADARKSAAHVINAKAEEVYFTAGGTESDNWAIKATVDAYKAKGNHIITTKVEHHAVLHTCDYLEKHGCRVTYLDTDEFGRVDLQALEDAICDDTILISVIFANNEIGTVNPIAKIGEIARKHGVIFHTDAVQAYCKLPIDVDAMNIDMLSASAHKFAGPKGVGLLYIRKGLKLRSYVHGGKQERARRAGTENVPGIVGFGSAARIACENLEKNADKETRLRDYLIDRVLNSIPHVRLNGHPTERLPGNVSLCFRFIEGESLLMMLDSRGICASSGSACTSGSLDPSHVLLAIGLSHEIAHGSLRISISELNTIEEMDFVADALAEIVPKLRAMSPLYEDYLKKNK